MDVRDGSEAIERVTIRVPIGGMFPSLFHYLPGMTNAQFERTLAPGCTWRRTTDADRELIRGWFDFFKDWHSDEAANRGAYEPTVLATAEPVPDDEEHMHDWGNLITLVRARSHALH